MVVRVGCGEHKQQDWCGAVVLLWCSLLSHSWLSWFCNEKFMPIRSKGKIMDPFSSLRGNFVLRDPSNRSQQLSSLHCFVLWSKQNPNWQDHFLSQKSLLGALKTNEHKALFLLWQNFGSIAWAAWMPVCLSFARAEAPEHEKQLKFKFFNSTLHSLLVNHDWAFSAANTNCLVWVLGLRKLCATSSFDLFCLSVAFLHWIRICISNSLSLFEMSSLEALWQMHTSSSSCVLMKLWFCQPTDSTVENTWGCGQTRTFLLCPNMHSQKWMDLASVLLTATRRLLWFELQFAF